MTNSQTNEIASLMGAHTPFGQQPTICGFDSRATQRRAAGAVRCEACLRGDCSGATAAERLQRSDCSGATAAGRGDVTPSARCLARNGGSRARERLFEPLGSTGSAAAGAVEEEEMSLCVRWAGKELTVGASGDDTVGELKRRICEATGVLPSRQKLLNLKLAGRPAPDSTLLSQLAIKPSLKLMMMGTVESEIVVGPSPQEAPDVEVLDDLQLPEDEAVAIKDRPENLAKLRRRSQHFKLKVLNPPRAGKRLLVLDIDYTLFDHVSPAENAAQLMRPYLHEFLAASYSAYDIIIWSATSMRWVEVKMRELGVLGHSDYRVLALVDHMAMITVHSPHRGVFDCKPLQILWDKFPEHYSEANTIMFDDLRRNFVMNPRNGLTIRPFRRAHANRHSDRELAHLTEYLLAIADLDDWSQLDHNQWERFMRRLKK
ncbi:unnamed protein product [Closterium sp. NIES-64]|nr:unnamed protein product [Closterium sp. NIES-64]